MTMPEQMTCDMTLGEIQSYFKTFIPISEIAVKGCERVQIHEIVP